MKGHDKDTNAHIKWKISIAKSNVDWKLMKYDNILNWKKWKFQEFTCSVLYIVHAKNITFGGNRAKIDPECIFDAKSNVL